MKKLYLSPSVRFDSLRLQESIADKCWGWDASHHTGSIFYDPDNDPSTGYIEFQITKFVGKCEDKLGDEIDRECKVLKGNVSGIRVARQPNNFHGCDTSLS